MKKYTPFLPLFIIVIIGSALRLYNINWDDGFHLHPDERAITMFVLPLQLPESVSEFFSPASPLNPHFFAYGSFPIYLLKVAGNSASIIDPSFATYEKINLLGRFLSAIFDIGTLIVLFFLARKLFNNSVGLLAAFFYAISVLPIQLSHFYAVDTPLTFFVLLTLYLLIKFYEYPTFKNAFFVGIFFGLSLATKTSALVLLSSIGLAIVVDFLLIFIKNPHRPHIWSPHLPVFIKRLCIDDIIIVITALVIFAITEPYAFIDFSEFWKQNMQQAAMTRDAFTFPYTLQYVGKIPYVYEVKNIFFWGLGPLLATLSFIGALYFTIIAFRKEKQQKWAQELILATFFWAYFLVIGNFAIGFMRYLLPIYPFLCLFAAVLLLHFFTLLKRLTNNSFTFTLYTTLLIALCIWPLSFVSIYSQPHSRISASDWMIKNIPPNSLIGTESWDDTLPVGYSHTFRFLELPMNERDVVPSKWERINEVLDKADYIVLSSNRNYTPLQKLIDCKNLPNDRCYLKTAQFYKSFFKQELGFVKVIEFSSFPTIPILNIYIDDQNSDESFTVYDHPKVLIFKNEKK